MNSPASPLLQLGDWWTNSPHVLITAGAGLSVAAGIDYTDATSFARLFPALVLKGFSARSQLIGYSDWTEAEKWGYWAAHIHDVRFTHRVSAVYERLYSAIRGKDYFVLTSNVDAMFLRHGFHPDRLYTPQGDYARLQCLRPCSERTWPSGPIISELLPCIDQRTQTVTDRSRLPRCPDCDGPVFPNVRAGDWFSEQPYVEQQQRFGQWLQAVRQEPLLVVELGAGFNTPSVVRWRSERIVAHIPTSRFVRVNPAAPDVPAGIASRSLALREDAAAAVAALPII